MKIQNEMATRISVDTVAAIGSMRAFRDAVSAVNNSWRAQENTLRGSGQYFEALKARISGLNQEIDLQKAKISELRSRQEGLDRSNTKQASKWLSLEKQISQANKQLAGYEGQLGKARERTAYYASGLAELQRQTQLNVRVSQSYVERLRAEGRQSEASKAELSGLRSTLAGLESQQNKQQFMLKQIEHQSGRTSSAYKQQQIQLNKTGTEIAKTNARMNELKKSLNPPKLFSWGNIRNNFLKVDEAEKKAKQSAVNFKEALKADMLGGWLSQGLSSLTSGLKSVITNGYAASQAGAALQARWKNIGLSSRGVKQLSDQVTDLKTNTNLTAQTVNSLQTRFYGMTHSVTQTRELTKGVGSLADQLKLSDQQANAFAGGLSRIESSGKVTSSSLGRLEKQAPGLQSALQRASGMSKKSFEDLVSSGKMTSDQFNQILANASKSYDKNSKAFGQSSAGAMHKLRAEWTSTQAKMAQPLLKISATGLNELSSALQDKGTQKGLQLFAKGLADIAVFGAKAIATLAKYHKVVVPLVATLGTLGLAFKTVQVAMVAFDVISNANPFALLVGGIAAATVALTALGVGINKLVHTKQFRAWLKSVGKAWNSFAKTMRKGIRSAADGIVKGFSGIIRSGRNFFNTMQRNHRNYERQQTRLNQQAVRDHQRTWNTISRNTSRTSKAMWQRASRDARNGWNYVVRWGGNSSKTIARDWNWMNRQTTRVAQTMFRNHRRTFQAGYKVLTDRTRIWRDVVTLHWSRLGTDTRRLAQDMSRFHQRIFSDMYNKLNDLTGGRLGDMLKTFQRIFGSIGDAVSNAVGVVHRHFVDLVRGVLSPFKTLIDDIKDGINWILDKLGASKIGGDFSISIPGYANGTPNTHPGGLARVNDGTTPHYREMYQLPNGKLGMFPAKRNLVLPLPKGTSVLDGERSYQLSKMLGIIPHYADGIGQLSDMFTGILSSAEDMLNNVEKILAHPIEFAESVFKKFVRVSTPIKLASTLVEAVPKFIAKNMAAWIKKQFEVLANPGGSGVERWRPYVIRAAKMEGIDLTATMMRKMLTQINTESKGNPSAIGGTDGLNDGHATGLLQFKPGTFRHWIWHGHGNIMNGFDQILAAFNALQHGGEGGWGNFGIPGRGWANGGLITQHGLYEVGEYNRPEMIVPLDLSKRSRAYQLLGEIVARFQADEPAHGTAVQSNSVDDEQIKALNRKFDTLLNMFSQLLGISSDQVKATKGISVDRKALYKQQALDVAMRSFS